LDEGLGRWWRSPLWVLALATGAKSFADNPILASKRLNPRGLHVARLKLAHRLAWTRRRRLASAVQSEWREQFDRDGFVAVPNFLPEAKFARIRGQLTAGTFDTREQQQGDTITRRIAVDPIFWEKSRRCSGCWRTNVGNRSSLMSQAREARRSIISRRSSPTPRTRRPTRSWSFMPTPSIRQ